MNSLNIASCNIRFENPKDGVNDWPNRKPLLLEALRDFSPDILGTQEGREPQIRNLHEGIAHLSLADDHRQWLESRMYPTIFFNPERLHCLQSGDIWLSETPQVPGSVSFQSMFPRLCTWTILEMKQTDVQFLVINVHLDHVRPKTRLAQITVLIDEVEKINSQNLPVILLGDFNEDPRGDVRNHITNRWNLNDAWNLLGKKEQGSFHQFDGNTNHDMRIDWILTSEHFNCQNIYFYQESKENIFPSDHFPLFGVYQFTDGRT